MRPIAFYFFLIFFFQCKLPISILLRKNKTTGERRSTDIQPAKCAADPQQRESPGASKMGMGGPECEAYAKRTSKHSHLHATSIPSPIPTDGRAGRHSMSIAQWMLMPYASVPWPSRNANTDAARASQRTRLLAAAPWMSLIFDREDKRIVGMCATTNGKQGKSRGINMWSGWTRVSENAHSDSSEEQVWLVLFFSVSFGLPFIGLIACNLAPANVVAASARQRARIIASFLCWFIPGRRFKFQVCT